MASIVVSGDTSGTVTISAPAVAGTTTLTLPSTSGTVLTTASSTGISGSAISSGTVAEAYGGTGTNTGYYGFKNRIINGAMVIDQRNAGASFTPTDPGYMLDRYFWINSQSGKFTGQQNLNNVTPPVGFTNYLGLKNTSAVTIGAGDYFGFKQRIEGFNFADMQWGTANAKTITLSFWVNSSITGTFGGSLCNSGQSRSYPFTYSISSANTWEQKSITIAGDTSGTWVGSTNGIGVELNIGLGCGSTYSGTAGSWASAVYVNATGNTASFMSTVNSTFYITGIQLEKGSTATSFDYRPYGTELLLCQRYYYTQICTTGGTTQVGTSGQATTSNTANGFTVPFPASMRTSPSALTTSTLSGFQLQPPGGGGYIVTAMSLTYSSQYQASLTITVTGGGFSGGQATWLYFSATGNYIGFSAEL